MNRPYLINLKDYEQLIALDKIMKTKAGHLWKCGKGYRKDWNKLIGCLVLLHGKSYTLISRQKIDGVWYLTFKDDKYQYTEKQDQALYNKNLSKNAKIEELAVEPIQVTYQLCLPAPRPIEDTLLDEAIRIADTNNLEPWDDWGLDECTELAVFSEKVFFIYATFSAINQVRDAYIRLVHAYHPDHNGNSEKYNEVVLIYNVNYRN